MHTFTKTVSDHHDVVSSEDNSDREGIMGMDCERDSHNPSLKDASSLSQLVDSVVAEVHQLNEPISGVSESDYDYEPHTLLSPALVQAFDPNSCKSGGTGNLQFIL